MRITVRSVVPATCALAILAAAPVPHSHARKAPSRYHGAIPSRTPSTWVSRDHGEPGARPLRAIAVPDTTWLGYWTFDVGAGLCTDEGWVSVDNNETVVSTHVDDFAGLGGGAYGRLVPIEGNQSLWCGLRPDTLDYDICSYASLPGYGNYWYQTFGTSRCNTVTGPVFTDFLITWDSEPGYDDTRIQFSKCDDDWITIPLSGTYAGGLDGHGEREFFSVEVPDTLHTGSLGLRFLFVSDGAWSDQDGLFNSDGAYVLDSLTVTDASGVVLPTELFEAESVGDVATASGNWESNQVPAYGDFAALYNGIELVQEDPCQSNFSCVWAFISGSTVDYTCGGFPGQLAVPYGNEDDQYIDNEIRSPWVPMAGDGSTFEIGFDVYKDLPLDPLVFFVWHLRSLVDGCPERWEDRNFVFYGDEKAWVPIVEAVGDLVSPQATHLQLALGAIDMCGVWCGMFGSGGCHSHSPMFDNAWIRRINHNGAAWSVRDIDLFQDNFSTDGTTTGTVRIDMAIDKLSNSASNIRAGDSTVVQVADLENALATDPHTGVGPAVYMVVGVWPQGQPGKTGAALSSDPLRWPVVDSLTHAGSTWYYVRMDTVFSWLGRENPQPDRYCVDLNDDLFTPGDMICYFFAATSEGPASLTTYYSSFIGTTDDLGYALANPMEVTCLPKPNPLSSRRILYVDNADGLGVQPFFDTAFRMLGLEGDVDRYDVLGPSRQLENGPAARIADPIAQLVSSYHTIIWNSGDLTRVTLGDGNWSGDKVDDIAMLMTFLDNLPVPGGIYFSGDHLASDLLTLGTASANTFRNTYMNFDVLVDDHTDFALGVSPLVVGTAGGCFDHAFTGPDTLVAFGGCPYVHRFDVLQAAGASTMEALYLGGGTAAAAVLAQKTTNAQNTDVGVMLSGFSFDAIRDDTAQYPPDRVEHLSDIITWLGNMAPVPSPAGGPAHATALAQNYPNPFNPSTTIEFTLRQRTPVSLRVYNVAGQRVVTLVDEERAPGIVHRVAWDGRNDAGQNVASGVYFYRLTTRDYTRTRKMVLLK